MSRTNKENLVKYTQYLKSYIANQIDPVIAETVGNVTIATFNIPAENTAITLQQLSNVSIDWGDGVINNELSHTYKTTGTYACKIYNAASIGEKAFYQNENLTSITIGNSVNDIGTSAFEGCSNLVNIVLPEGLTNIGGRAIRETAITNIVLPSTVTSVGNYAFYGCTKLKSFIMADGLNATFGKQIFGSDSSLTEVKLSNSLTRLPNRMFQNCTALKSIIIPKSVATIDSGYTFLNCTNLTVYCEREEKDIPSGWDSTWSDISQNGPKCPVVWGYKHKDYPEVVTKLSDSGSVLTPTIVAAAGANINSVGTPSVTASTSENTTTFTFNYLKGAPGATGATGPMGPEGPQGIQGEKGEKGDTGDVGPKGDTGPQGPQGEPGPQGPKGADGTMTFADLTPEQKASLKGDKGEKGDKGDKGDTGEPGPQGIPGEKGDKGDKGDTGTSVTIKSINQNNDAGGTSTITFSDGKTLSIKNGIDGTNGTGGTALDSEEFSIAIQQNGSNVTGSLVHGNTYSIVAGGASCSFTLPTAPSDTKVAQTAVSSGTTDYYILASAQASPTSGTAYGAKYNTAIKLNGEGQVSAPSFIVTSDRRKKENIKEFIPQKSILDLPIVEFDFKDSGLHQIGCIAQDLQEICPEIVTTDSQGYLSISESKLVYLLLDEVKKLKTEVETLKRGE